MIVSNQKHVDLRKFVENALMVMHNYHGVLLYH